MTIRVAWNQSADPNIASFDIQSSADQITWVDRVTITSAIPGANWDPTRLLFYWDDSTGTVTTWYRVRARDALNQLSSWSPPFEATLVDMTYVCGGSMSLARLLQLARWESDTENDPHITDAELTMYLNQSRMELYDILVTRFGEDYYSAQAQIPLVAGTALYPLPNGILYGGVAAGALCHYKGLLVEAISGPTVIAGQPVTLTPFNLREKNRYNLPQTLANFPFMLPRYRLNGSNILFAPTPVAAGITVNLWYAPKLMPLFQTTDMAEDWGGWLEYVVVDAAIKCLNKQERDPQAMMLRKAGLKTRIEATAPNRNLGDPNTVVETGLDYGGGFAGGGSFGMNGPWG
jgi:hypothetical protein